MTMPTFVDGTIPNAANLNAISSGISNLGVLLTGVAATRQMIPTVSAYINKPQTIPNGADTIVKFDAATINEDNLWIPSTASSPTVHTAGTYIVWAQINWDYNAIGIRAAHVLANGTSALTNSIAAGSGNTSVVAGIGTAFLCISPPLQMPAFIPVYLSVYQNTGGPLNLIPNESGTSLSLIRIGN